MSGFNRSRAYGVPTGVPSWLEWRLLRWVVVAIVILFAFFSITGPMVSFWLNAFEFGEVFVRPIRFQVIGGLILAAIALFRIDFKHRRSLTWWLIRFTLRLIREHGMVDAVPPDYIDFNATKLTVRDFALWQVTKVILAMLYFRNEIFGMVVVAMGRGWDLGLSQIWGIFKLPFVTPPFDIAYANQTVVPLMPILTLVISPVLTAVAIRALVLVGLTSAVGILAPIAGGLGTEMGMARRMASVEILTAISLFLAAFYQFFPINIDYNTRYWIGGLMAAGVLFLFFAYMDRYRSSGLSLLARRRILNRVIAVVLIVLLSGSIMSVNNSVADARKVEWLGPYTTQQIALGRYLAQLDEIKELPYNFTVSPVPVDKIDTYTQQQQALLNKTRIWDWEAAFAKLKPEIGLIPYIDFQDSDILRFGETLYWSASMKPVLPTTVLAKDRWYSEHMYYTNVPNGYLMLDSNTGGIVDSGKFFEQRRIYYGEGGLFLNDWVFYPIGRTRSDELGGAFYKGTGGVTVNPPLTWFFESIFFLSYTTTPVQLMRYRDIYARMKILYPYFNYNFPAADRTTKNVDVIPVSTGNSTYWLMPLIVNLPTNNVPWSGPYPFRRLVGYALIDVYNGTTKIIVVGNDYFSELFKTAYGDLPNYVTTEVPNWLDNQLRYPQELFEWRNSLYNYFHVKDPATYIVGKEFYEVPAGIETYYIMAQSPDAREARYVGLLSLELRGAGGRNLAGYMIVQNDLKNLGQMTFYKVSLEAETKLLGPTAILEALERNPEFATLRTLLRNPRIGDKILYRIGEQDVYVVPVYTAGAGGVVAELGTVAVIGATFTGKYYVGLGGNINDAFKSYLTQMVGAGPRPPTPTETVEQRKQKTIGLFDEKKLTTAQPEAIYPNVKFLEGKTTYTSSLEWNNTKTLVNSFIEKWCADPDKVVLIWTEKSTINFGVLVNVKGVVELHYIAVTLE